MIIYMTELTFRVDRKILKILCVHINEHVHIY